MKKKFIVAGELSGDITAAWYIEKKNLKADAYLYGVGGEHMAAHGVELVRRYYDLNITGVLEVVAHLPRIFRIMRELVAYVVAGGFDEVILVDFPGFNIRFAARLKKIMPNIIVTYVAPPQMWCWGAWRVRKIRRYFDNVVVLYPFEEAWYKERGVRAQWIGCSTYDAMEPYMHDEVEKEPLIALIPGSRTSEIHRLASLIVGVAQVLHDKYPMMRFVMPLASSLSEDFIKKSLKDAGLQLDSFPLAFVRGDAEKYHVLQRCCLAVTKPGTVTLELALLDVPSVVFFKISMASFLLAWFLVKVKYMSLPNLLLHKRLLPEAVQRNCTVEYIVTQSLPIIDSFLARGDYHRTFLQEITQLRGLLSFKKN
ncbi:MAG: Lipid-A-disaccharide synthase [candidate division TM6 bacterium GW2011_GWF2_38_10]|nr:MAG: Lipid-A-disaccharide synthase [candidate division TM6 bacterium GW2011_GWF2_38_10]